MIEVFQAMFSPVNIVFTVLLLLAVFYWLLMVLGALDIDFLNIDADADADIDADVEPGLMMEVLEFFYVGRVPIMVLYTLFVLSLWVISMVGNYLLNPWDSGWIALGVAAGDVVVSLAVLKAIGRPLARLFGHLYEDPNKAQKAVGQVGVVVTHTISSEKMGQVEVSTGGAPFLLNAMTGGEELHRGDQAVVLEHDKPRDVYIVAPLEEGDA